MRSTRIAALTFGIFISGVGPTLSFASEGKPSTEQIKQKAGETASATADYVNDTKEEFSRKMEANVASVQAQIDSLKKRAADSAQSERDRMNREIGKLELRRDELQARMRALQKSSSNAWSELEDGVAAAWRELKSATSRARAEFGSAPEVTPTPIAPSTPTPLVEVEPEPTPAPATLRKSSAKRSANP